MHPLWEGGRDGMSSLFLFPGTEEEGMMEQPAAYGTWFSCSWKGSKNQLLLFCSVTLTSTTACVFCTRDCDILSRGARIRQAALNTKCVFMLLPSSVRDHFQVLWVVRGGSGRSALEPQSRGKFRCCKFSLSSMNSDKAPEGMCVLVLAGTESSSKFSVLSSSYWKGKTWWLFWFMNFSEGKMWR